MTLLLLLAAPAAHAQAWWDPTWSERARLSFDNVGSATDLTEFPVLVVLRQGVNFDHALASPLGDDLRFVDDDGATVLSYEIERWDEGGTSWLWVRVPRIDAGSAADHVWLYYGNPSATPGVQGTPTWEPSFAAVFHLDGLADATAGGHDGTDSGTLDVVGLIGHARDSDGDEDRISVPDEQAFDFTSAVTVSFWVHVDAWVHDSWDALVTKGDQTWRVHRCGGGSAVAFSVDFDDDSQGEICGTAPLDDGLPHYVVATYDGAAQSLWVDGVLAHTEARTGTIATSNDRVWLAGNADFGERSLDGQLDEVRIASVGRSADWIAADFRSVTDTLVTWCSRWAGDADGDGVCDDTDGCPGVDDLLDADADGTSDCLEAPIDSGADLATADTGGPTPVEDTALPTGPAATRPDGAASGVARAGCDCRTAGGSASAAWLLAWLGLRARRRAPGRR